MKLGLQYKIYKKKNSIHSMQTYKDTFSASINDPDYWN